MVVVGRWTTTGLPRLVQALVEITHHVPRERVVPVLSGTPRATPGRLTAVRALDGLLTEAAGGPWPAAVAVAEDRGVEPTLREARPLPRRLVAQVDRVLDRC